MGMQS